MLAVAGSLLAPRFQPRAPRTRCRVESRDSATIEIANRGIAVAEHEVGLGNVVQR